MTRPKAPPPRDDLATRNAQHVPCYWMMLTPAEAHELAEGRIPEQVQAMAQWLDDEGLGLTLSAPDWSPYTRSE